MSACSGFVPQAVCLLLAFAMPTALLNVLAPVQVCLAPFCPFCFAPCSFHVCQDRTNKFTSNMFASCKTVPLAATTRVCSGGPRTVLCPPHHYRCCKTACRQPQRGDCIWAAHAPLSATHKRGRPRTACGQPAKFPTPAFHEPETACEQPGSLLTFSLCRVHLILGHGGSLEYKVKMYCFVNMCAPPACLCLAPAILVKSSE